MKLVGKKEQAYASLDMESPHVAPIRRSNSSLSNVQLSPSAASTVSISSERSYSSNPTRRESDHSDGGRPFYTNVANDILAALDGPVRQLAFETKGALLATGCVELKDGAVFASRRLISAISLLCCIADWQRRATC